MRAQLGVVVDERSDRLPLSTLLPYAVLIEVLASLAFEAFYVGANFVTSLHHFRVPVGADWELAIPLLPQAIPVYWSLWGMFLLAPFILGSKRRINELALLVVAESAVAALVFVLCPTEARYLPPLDLGWWSQAYHATMGVSLRYNLFPSLHVAFAVTCALACGAVSGRKTKMAMGLWAAAIAASTLLLHLHHVIDIFGGAALAWTAFVYGRRPLATAAAWRVRTSSPLTVERGSR